MRRCPITYEMINDSENYSRRGLRMLATQLTDLHALPFSAAEQREEAIARVGKMSIQGIQAKLSAQLKIKENRFEIVDQAGQYILKPQSAYYPELPENEALTMTLASYIGLEVPVHGLIYSKDKTMTYFVKRFDRVGRHQKLAVEDSAQLLNRMRNTKYDSSMEKIAQLVNTYCSFPKIEAIKLLKLTLFNFLTGNEDMHLKNFSLITRDNKILLSPVYDLLNTSIAQKNTKEELALPLHGKKTKLTKKDFLNYFAHEQLQLNQNIINQVLIDMQFALPIWIKRINESFLSKTMQENYNNLLLKRADRLF